MHKTVTMTNCPLVHMMRVIFNFRGPHHIFVMGEARYLKFSVLVDIDVY